jgi:DNA-directed RNA polymerase subunit F
LGSSIAAQQFLKKYSFCLPRNMEKFTENIKRIDNIEKKHLKKLADVI